MKEKEVTKIAKQYEDYKDCKRLQKWEREVANTHHAHCILHIAQVTRLDKTIAAILAELNYNGTDFNLDYK